MGVWGCGDPLPVPEQLLGVWVTSAPAYQGRYLKIMERSLVFGLGAAGSEFHEIRNVESKPGVANETLYTLHHDDVEGESWRLGCKFPPADGGTIQFEHRDERWTRVDELPKLRDEKGSDSLQPVVGSRTEDAPLEDRLGALYERAVALVVTLRDRPASP